MKAYRTSLVWMLHMVGGLGQAAYVQFRRLLDILFGTHDTTLIDGWPIPVMLPMPEGDYYGDLTHFTLRIGRPRLPLPTIKRGAIVTMYGGIPIPDVQGSYGMVTSLSTPERDVQAALCDVLRTIAIRRAGLREVVA